MDSLTEEYDKLLKEEEVVIPEEESEDERLRDEIEEGDEIVEKRPPRIGDEKLDILRDIHRELIKEGKVKDRMEEKRIAREKEERRREEERMKEEEERKESLKNCS